MSKDGAHAGKQPVTSFNKPLKPFGQRQCVDLRNEADILGRKLKSPKNLKVARDRRLRWMDGIRANDAEDKMEEKLRRRAEQGEKQGMISRGTEHSEAAVEDSADGNSPEVKQADYQDGQGEHNTGTELSKSAKGDPSDTESARPLEAAKNTLLAEYNATWLPFLSSIGIRINPYEPEPESMDVDNEIYVDFPRCERCHQNQESCRGMKALSCEGCKRLNQPCSNASHGKVKKVVEDMERQGKGSSVTQLKGTAAKRKGAPIPVTPPKRFRRSTAVGEKSDEHHMDPSASQQDGHTVDAEGTTAHSERRRETLEVCAKATKDIMTAAGIAERLFERIFQDKRN